MSDPSSRADHVSPFRRITVASDGSPGAQAAVERAAQLAAQHGARLCLLQACAAGAADSTDAAVDERIAALRERLAGSASLLARRLDLQVESVVDIGPPHVVIGAHLKLRMPSLLVLGSRFDPATAGLGGTALKVLRASACPVLVVRTSGTRPYRNILSAVDLRDGSVRAAAAALSLFPQAHHHLLYAVAPAFDSSLADGGLDSAQVQSLHESMYRHAERELDLLAQGLSATSKHPVAAEVAGDVPARAVLVGAAALPADCVVVGHHDAAAIGQTELGSMALHVLQFMPGDVLVVP